MSTQFRLESSRRATLQVVIAYVVVAFAWILLSDRLLLDFVGDPERVASLQSVKGGVFVLVTGMILYLFLHRKLRRFEKNSSVIRRLMEDVPDVAYWFRVSPDRSFRFLNSAVERISGYPPEAFYQDPSFWERIVHPDDLKQVQLALSHPDETTSRMEFRLMRPDGSTRWVEIHMAFVRGVNGQVDSVLGIGRDVTERLESERQRRLLETALDAAGEAVLISDAGGNIEYANTGFERITGYRADDVRGRNPRFLKSGEQSDAFYHRMWRRLQSGQSFRGEFVNRRKDGALYRQDATITPVLDEAGNPTHFIAVGRDITEQRLIEGQLRQAQKAEVMGQVSVGIAHDSRNVLAVIQAHADLALAALDEDRVPIEELEAIRTAVRDGTRLLQGLLSLGHQETLVIKDTCLSLLIRDMTRTLRAVFPEAVEVQLDLEEELWATVDAGSVYQIILNLATNARDAMNAEGSFSIRLAGIENEELMEDMDGRQVPPKSWVRLEVSDTGTGMDEETRRRVFEPLFTTKPSDRGTGLGMSIVARLMELHHGRVTVESALGRGTVFQLYFPATTGKVGTDASPEVSHAYLDSDALPRGKETILIVEDEEALRRAMVRSLERLGYQTVSANDGMDAVDRLRIGSVDLVITDLIMPKMGGMELRDEMKVLGLEDLPVLFMSGYRAQDLQLHSPPAVSKGFLEKPWTLPELASKVRGLLDGT